MAEIIASTYEIIEKIGSQSLFHINYKSAVAVVFNRVSRSSCLLSFKTNKNFSSPFPYKNVALRI